VLALYTRRWILARTGGMDGEMQTRFTSNQFLANRGNPTEVEAEIGRIFENEGLEAAFGWIEKHLLPLFERQESKRKHKKP